MTPFTFEVGHNIPESKGGSLELGNLKPLCSNCNKSMGNNYTIDEFSKISKRKENLWDCFKFTGGADSRDQRACGRNTVSPQHA
jgi:hypothetical protein